MTIEQLRKSYSKEPFEPFDIYLADGRVISVPHREFIYVPPKTDRTFAVADNHGVIETFDLLMVVSLKPMNGKSGGGRRKAG